MNIYGAGMAGLICANIMRRRCPILHEIKEEMPHNHGALLRFRTDKVSRASGIPFKKVSVQKGVWSNGEVRSTASIADHNMYSQKVTGKVTGRSINNLTTCDRFVAPSDFIKQVSVGLDFRAGSPLTMDVIEYARKIGKPIISTIPMPDLMDIVGWEDKPDFNYLPIWSYTAKITEPLTDIYQTIYYPDKDLGYYRASITGDVFILELLKRPFSVSGVGYVMNKILLEAFGISSLKIHQGRIKYQKYGKLLAIDEGQRRRFILAMSDLYGVYSVGRFATWRQILLDDIVDDINVVEHFIDERCGGNYTRRLS